MGLLYSNIHPLPSPRVSVDWKQPISHLGHYLVSISQSRKNVKFYLYYSWFFLCVCVFYMHVYVWVCTHGGVETREGCQMCCSSLSDLFLWDSLPLKLEQDWRSASLSDSPVCTLLPSTGVTGGLMILPRLHLGVRIWIWDLWLHHLSRHSSSHLVFNE